MRALIATAALSFALSAHAQLQGVPVADIQRDANPCADFDVYANGQWRADHAMPAIQTSWARRVVARDETDSKLRAIAEADAANSSKLKKGSPAQLTGDFYAGCIDEATINKRGLDPVLKLAHPANDIKGVIAQMIYLQQYGIRAPWGVSSSQDPHNPIMNIAEVGLGGLGLPDREYYLRNEPRYKNAREKYVVHVAKMFQLAGASEADAKAATEAVMRIETALAEARMTRVELREPKNTDHPMSWAEAKATAPHFDWDLAFKELHVPTSVIINVSQPKEMAAFDKLLTATSVSDWQSYLRWHIMHSQAARLTNAIADENFAFYGTVLSGVKEQKPRWQRCVAATDRELGEALGHEYVDKYFPPEAKSRAREMAVNIAAELKRSIETRDWMTAPTRARALDKVNKLNIKVGYPDKWKTYAGVTADRAKYFETALSADAYDKRDDLAQIGHPVDRQRWDMTPPTLNAYYNPLMNEIVVPAGYLQPPGFNLKGIDAVNYGAIGVTIGHEISHGVDDEGAQFSAEGKLEKWWTDADYKNFTDRTACTTKQYDAYFVEPELHLNGKLVTGEALGDLGGVNLALRAYHRSREAKGPEPTIDGFTPDQQFFLAEAQWRGMIIRPEMARTLVSTDPHPPGKYRVLGPLSNMPEFQKAFSCKATDAMVRAEADRCVVW